jgi:hypothetical protein
MNTIFTTQETCSTAFFTVKTLNRKVGNANMLSNGLSWNVYEVHFNAKKANMKLYAGGEIHISFKDITTWTINNNNDVTRYCKVTAGLVSLLGSVSCITDTANKKWIVRGFDTLNSANLVKVEVYIKTATLPVANVALEIVANIKYYSKICSTC